MNENVFRSHDWAISEDGRLTPKPETAQRHLRDTVKDCLENADQAIADSFRFLLSKLSGISAPVVMASAPAVAEVKPERSAPRRAAREPEPEASIEWTPEPETAPRPAVSQHDTICSEVSRLVREGKSYSEAMDIVLGDEPEPKRKREMKFVSGDLLERAAQLKASLPGDFQSADNETLIEAVRQLSELQDAALQERANQGKKAIKLPGVSEWSLERELKTREGCFHPYAINAIIKGHDIRPLLEMRLALIQSGKL